MQTHLFEIVVLSVQSNRRKKVYRGRNFRDPIRRLHERRLHIGCPVASYERRNASEGTHAMHSGVNPDCE